MARRWTWACMAMASVSLAAAASAAASTAQPTFSASSITAPAPGAELFYDADTGSGSVTVSGTVTPLDYSGSGDLLCYSAPAHPPFTVATGIPVSAGGFSAEASLSTIASTACRLRFVPHGTTPGESTEGSYGGPQVSVSEQLTDSSGGNVFGYYVLSGTLDWSFALGSLGQCPVEASYSTDPQSLGSYLLFDGNACLLAYSGIAPNQGTRSSVQVDGVNAYPPGVLSGLTGSPGFSPLGYTASFDANHDTVTITETDALEECQDQSGGDEPPLTAQNCTGLASSGVDVTQTTTLLPGGQVTRVSQTFTSLDGNAHSLDLLFNQSVTAPASGETPAFQFPGQPVFASHEAPDSFSLFPNAPGSIYLIADASGAPAISNPTGAITYEHPPTSADFVSGTGAQTASFLMHYVETVPAGGSWTQNWAFSQAADATDLSAEVSAERDRWYSPTLTLSAPRASSTQSSPVTVKGVATDPVGISSVSVNGQAARLASSGGFAVAIKLHRGVNMLRVTASNVAGVAATITRQISYQPPPCVVPRLKRQTLASARKLLATHACRVGTIVKVHSSTIAAGRVASSSPGPGARRAHGARVRLSVSLGRAKQRATGPPA